MTSHPKIMPTNEYPKVTHETRTAAFNLASTVSRDEKMWMYATTATQMGISNTDGASNATVSSGPRSCMSDCSDDISDGSVELVKALIVNKVMETMTATVARPKKTRPGENDVSGFDLGSRMGCKMVGNGCGAVLPVDFGGSCGGFTFSVEEPLTWASPR